jgi:acyl transferase domain-containing protein/acyl carrier protein
MRSEPAASPALDATVVEPVAVVSVGCRLPGGIRDLTGLSRVLHRGEPVLQDVPADRWSRQFCDETMQLKGTTRSHVGAFLSDVQRFDAEFFGISPREAREMDPQQRVLLEVAWETLHGAGYSQADWAGSSTGVFAGVLASDYLMLHSKTRGIDGIDPFYATGKEFSFGAGRIAYSFDLQGPVMTITTACSSSLLAVHLACQSLRAGECDAALAGGVNLLIAPELTVFMSQVGAVSPTGRSAPFSATADGVVRGEGCALVLLKRMADAERDGDEIVAVINGSAVNHDGHSAGLTVPSAPAQARLVRRALDSAGIAPEEIGYLEAHATGTPLGDPIELAALQEVFHREATAAEPLLVGSHKAIFGHLDSAAGILGLLKAITVVRDGLVPPQPALDELTPHFDWANGGLRIATEASRLATVEDRPRRAGVSAFGLSGTNVHVVLSQPPATVSGRAGSRPELPEWSGEPHWLVGVQPGEQGSSGRGAGTAATPAPVTDTASAVTQPAADEPAAPGSDAASPTGQGDSAVAGQGDSAVAGQGDPAVDLSDIRERVHAAVRQVLGLSDTKPVPAQRPLLDQGLTSITAVELATLLSSTFDTPKDPTLVYLCPRVEDLVTHFADLAPVPCAATSESGIDSTPAADSAPAAVSAAPADPAPAAAPLTTVPAAPIVQPSPAVEAVPATGPSPAVRTPAGPRGADRPGALAIVGMACRVPGAGTVEEFWQLIRDGAVQVRDLPEHRRERDGWSTVSPDVPTRGGYLDNIEGFDAGYFKISPMEAERIDPQQRLFLEVASEALADAGIVVGSETAARTGVYVGMNTTDYQQRLTRAQSDVDVYYGTGNCFAGTPGRLAYALNLSGPCLSVDTACSSSLTAVHLAGQALRSGDCDVAVVAGVNVISGPTVSISMARGGALAADGHCKTFAEDADGYGRGEGAGVIVLKRLDRALADGDQIYATVLGSAVNSDGASGGFTVPNAAAQTAVVTAALESAGARASDVGYVEAHGTGTPLGDPIELQALSKALRPDSDDAVYVGSVKSLVGHLEAAAGIVGLIKAALSVHHDEIAPHRLAGPRTGRLNWRELGIRLADDVTDWPVRQQRVAGVSAFGFTGSNAHVVLGQAPAARPKPTPSQGTVARTALVVSADSSVALREHAAQLAAVLDGGARLEELAYTVARHRSAYRYRAVVLAEDSAAAREALMELAADHPHPDLVLGSRAVSEPSEICFRFGSEAYLGTEWAYLPDDLRLAGNNAAAEIDSLTPKLTRELSSIQRQRVATLRAQVGWLTIWRRLGLRQATAIGQGVGAQTAAWARGEISLGTAVERALHASPADDLQAERASAVEDHSDTVTITVVPSCVATSAWSWLQAHGFVAGYPTSWSGIIAETGRRIALPAYPWQRRDYWFTSTAAASVAASVVPARETVPEPAGVAQAGGAPQGTDEQADPIRELLFSFEWQPVELAAATGTPGGRWLILADPQASSARELAAQLELSGQDVQVADLPGHDPSSWTSALATAAGGSAINAVLMVSGRSDAELLAMLFGQAVQRFPGSLGKAYLLTQQAHPFDADTAPRPDQAAAWAVGAVLATELSRRWGRSIDLAGSGVPASALASALLSEQAGDQVRLDGTRCHTRRITRALDGHDPEPGMVDAELRFAVHGPDLETVQPVLSWLAAKGVRGALLQLDEPAATVPGTDGALSVEQVVDESRWLDQLGELAATGQLGGLVYCTEHQSPPVTVRDANPAELAAAPAGELLAAAIDRLGLDNPHADATAADAPTGDAAPGLVLLLTDAAGDWGAVGAAASGARRARERAVLRQRPELRRTARVLSLLPREHSDAAAGTSVLQADSGIGLLSPRQVTDLLDYALRAPAGTELSAGVLDVERYVSVCQRLAPRALLDELGTGGTGESQQNAVLTQLRELDPARRSARLLDLVLTATAAVLGLQARELDPDTGFFDLGMDSIIAVSLKTRLEHDTDTELPVTLTFELPTPRKVARHLAELLDPRPAHPASEPAARSPRREALTHPAPRAVPADDTTAAEATDDELLTLLSRATASARDLLQEASQW